MSSKFKSRNLLQILNIKNLAYFCIALASILTLWFLVYGNYIGGNVFSPDLNKIKDIQPFISGSVVPLITFGTSLLIIETFRNNSLQNISNNFFKLIDQNRKLLEGVNCDSEPDAQIKGKGKDYFDDLAAEIAIKYLILAKEDAQKMKTLYRGLLDAVGQKKEKELLVALYNHYFHIYQSDLSHYFRNLYYIVRYIDRANIKTTEKYEFIKILRSQLSNYEILILAYNGLHPYGTDFYPLIEKYELLKSLNTEMNLPTGYVKRIIELKVLTDNYPHLKKYWNS